MKAHTLNLHKHLRGTFLAKGMINDNNKHFIEECILKQNKINNQSATLEIYKLTEQLLHLEYTKQVNNISSKTTLYQEIINDPATIQLEQTNLTTKEGKYFLVYHANLCGRAMSLFHKIQMRAQASPHTVLFNGYSPELGRRQHRSMPGFYITSPTNQCNYLDVLMGNRDAATKADRSLGPQTTKSKPTRPSIAIDTKTDDFPDLPPPT